MPDLWHELKQAIAHPDLVDLVHLWTALDEILASTPDDQKLPVAAEAIAQIAEVYAAKAGHILDSLEPEQPPTEPILEGDFLSALVAQSSSLSLDTLVESAPPERRQRATKPTGSIVGSVDKQQLLDVLDQMNPVNLAYQENVSEWAEAIAHYLSQRDQVPLLELHQALQMPLVEIWLGVLLSGRKLEQTGEFYDPAGIVVKA